MFWIKKRTSLNKTSLFVSSSSFAFLSTQNVHLWINKINLITKLVNKINSIIKLIFFGFHYNWKYLSSSIVDFRQTGLFLFMKERRATPDKKLNILKSEVNNRWLKKKKRREKEKNLRPTLHRICSRSLSSARPRFMRLANHRVCVFVGVSERVPCGLVCAVESYLLKNRLRAAHLVSFTRRGRRRPA